MAIVAVAVAALVRAALTPVWGEFDRPYILFFPAVVFAAWYGRLGAAVVAIILGTLVANYLFLEPNLGFQKESVKQWTLLTAFVSVSFAIALLIERMHRATTRAVHEASERRRSEAALRDSEQELRTARDEAIEANAAKLGAAARIQLRAMSAARLPRENPFDLIFADPPYAEGSGSAVAHAVAEAGWLAPGGWLAIETAKGDDVAAPPTMSIEATRDVGRARLTLLRG